MHWMWGFQEGLSDLDILSLLLLTYLRSLSKSKAKSLRCFGDPGPEFQKLIVLNYKIEECESVQQMNNSLLPTIKKETETVFGTS